MKGNSIKLTIYSVSIYIGLFTFMLRTLLSYSSFVFNTTIIDNVLFVIAVTAFVIAITQQRYDKKRMIIIAVFSAMALITAFLSGQPFLLLTILVCVAIKNYDFDKVILLFFRLTLAIMVFHIGLSILAPGLFEMDLIIHHLGFRIRYTFGFIHPNAFSIIFFNLMLMWVWSNFEKIKYRHILGIFTLGLVAVMFSDTRSSFVVTVLLCLLLLLQKKISRFSDFLRLLASSIVPLFSLIVLWLITAFLQGNELARLINIGLTNRIRLGAFVYYNWGFSLLGQNLQNAHVGWDPLTRRWTSMLIYDNLYSFFMIEIGAVWLLVISIMFYFISKYNNDKVNICIIVWAFYGMTEVHGWNGFVLFPFLFFTFLLTFNNQQMLRIKEKN
jgi:hypothetical protein